MRIPPIHFGDFRGIVVRVAAALAIVLALAAPAYAGRPPGIGVNSGDGHDAYERLRRDPLIPLLHRVNRFFHAHEADGVTMDARYPINPSEAIRMSVVSQLLGYCELERVHPCATFRTDIVERARYLAARLDLVSSHTPFDGMLGYSLLEAAELTSDSVAFAAGETVVAELEAIPTSECILNGGLMVAMATAEQARIVDDPVAAQKTHDILALLPPYQHEDGSFPHWCTGSKDIHYTGWMGQELNLIQRMAPDPLVPPMLDAMSTFMEGRLDSAGRSIYEQPCADYPGCMSYYYSRATGCGFDYDTRGWTVEPAYQALLLDRTHSPAYARAMRFLGQLETGGTFKDVYGWWPPPSDPEYPWTIADTSVANTSIIFWTLATALSGRADLARQDSLWIEMGDVANPADDVPAGPVEVAAPAGEVAGRVRIVAVTHAAGTPALSVTAHLAAPGEAELALFDAAGRRVARSARVLAAGEQTWSWEPRDAAGARPPRGLYFLRLRSGGAADSRRVLLGP